MLFILNKPKFYELGINYLMHTLIAYYNSLYILTAELGYNLLAILNIYEY